MFEVLTFVLVELDRLSDPQLSHLVDEAVLAAGGAVVTIGDSVATTTTGTVARGPVVAAVFHLAGDATRAALQLSDRLRDRQASTGSSEAQPAGWARLALCTGEAHTASATLAGPALTRARELLRLTGPNQILVTASTAVMASAALPRGVELIDHGIRALGAGYPPERVYELSPTVRGNRDDAVSNLDWARRAAPGSVLGREEPLARLDSAWKATLDGRRQVVLLSGEGGIGKTTVAAELALRRHAEGALVLYGRWDQESLAPYQAVREALGTYAQTCPTAQLRTDLEGRSDEIARLLPDVGARVGGVRAPLHGDPEGERLRLFEAIEGWIDQLAKRHPLLVVLDDLHWAGHASQLLVDHLRAPGTAPVMIVLTAREGELDTNLQSGSGTSGLALDELEGVELVGLDRPAVAELVAQEIGAALEPGDDEVVDWLTRDTSGNPLFVQEVLRGVRGSVDPREALRTARHELPERLTDMVRWRLRQLPGRTADVLAAAAVVGPMFDLEVLATVTGTPPVRLRPLLQAAELTGLLRSPDRAGRHAFAHEVLRRALLDDVHDPEQRRALHRRIAAALASQAREGAEIAAGEVANHYLQGADATTASAAVRWARNAAEAGRRETAFESAVRLLTKAVDVHDRFLTNGPSSNPEDPDELLALACELRLELAEAHDRAGDFAARDRRHLEAAELARRLDRTELFVRAALGFGGRLPAATPPNPTARGLLEEALDRLPQDDSRGRALSLARLAQLRTLDASYEQRRARSDEAVAMARRLETPVVLAGVLMARCLTLDGPDDTEEQLEIGAEVIRIGERTGDPDLVLQGARVRMSELLVLGRHREARDLGDTFTQLAHQVRHPELLRLATMWEIMWAALRGDYAEAEEMSEELHQQLMASGHPQGLVIHFTQTLALRWLTGEVERNRPMLELLMSVAPHLPVWLATSASLETAAGHSDRALAQLAERDPIEFLAGVGKDYMWWPTMWGCAVGASHGNQAWAEALYDVISPYSGRQCVFGFAAYAGAIDHHLGTLALALDRTDDAVTHLERGLDQHRDLEAEPWVALSARWLTHALALRGGPGDSDRAEELRRESDELAERFDLHGLPELSDLPVPPR